MIIKSLWTKIIYSFLNTPEKGGLSFQDLIHQDEDPLAPPPLPPPNLVLDKDMYRRELKCKNESTFSLHFKGNNINISGRAAKYTP